MFVALILFSFLMSKQKHERNVEWASERAQEVRYVSLFGLYMHVYFYFDTHTHNARTYSEKLMAAIEKDEAKLQTKNGRSSSK